MWSVNLVLYVYSGDNYILQNWADGLSASEFCAIDFRVLDFVLDAWEEIAV